MIRTEEKRIYSNKALEEIPRLLSNLDRNEFSPTYGCFSREFWLTRVRDFPDAIAQFGTLSLALVWANEYPGGEQYHKNEEIKKWTIAGIKYWIEIQHNDGSFDEFYPNERGWAGPTGFLLYAMLRSYEFLGNDFPEDLKLKFFKAVKKSAKFLATREEPGVLANHHAMALLPIYQTYFHLKNISPVFSKNLLNHFNKRLESFFSFCNEEGWCLEYDGADPGYLSATVSFLSKMQKYMTGNEPWANKIQEVIDRAIKFSSYFFYPNGSYAGTIGSRQTLHFYPHGYEIQSPQNKIAATCADFGLRSLSENNLVPPGIQDDRYYLYRIPEFLEAEADSLSDLQEITKLPFQENNFDKYFKQAKILVKNIGKHYIVLNLAKGGVLKIFDKETKKLIFADDGIIATLKNNKVLTTQWIGSEYKIENMGNEWVVYGNFHKIPFKYFTPISMMAFRTFILLTGWNARLAEWIKGFIRDVLMTKSGKSKMKFERRFIIDDEKIEIMNLIETKGGVTSLRIGGQFASRYVPQSRYFQQEELENKFWTAGHEIIGKINKNQATSFNDIIYLNNNNNESKLL